MSNINQGKSLQIACQTYSRVYAAAVWSLHLQYQIHQLEKIQCSAARFVMNNYTHCRSITNNLSWSTLE